MRVSCRCCSEDGPICPVCFQIFDTELKDQEREVCFVDIAYDEIPERYYKDSEVSLCRCVCKCSWLTGANATGEVQVWRWKL